MRGWNAPLRIIPRRARRCMQRKIAQRDSWHRPALLSNSLFPHDGMSSFDSPEMIERQVDTYIRGLNLGLGAKGLNLLHSDRSEINVQLLPARRYGQHLVIAPTSISARVNLSSSVEHSACISTQRTISQLSLASGYGRVCMHESLYCYHLPAGQKRLSIVTTGALLTHLRSLILLVASGRSHY